MDKDLNQDKQERELWRRYSAHPAEPGVSQFDPNVLAEYLDGRAGTHQVETIEARMADDPAFLQEVKELRELSSLQEGPAPVELVDQLKALQSSVLKLHPAPEPDAGTKRVPWLRQIEWGAVAAAVLLACLGGYNLGRTTSQGQLGAGYSAASSISPALEELESDPVIGFVLPENGRNGGGE